MTKKHLFIAVPSAILVKRDDAANILKTYRVPRPHRGLLEATRDFACSLLQVFQSDEPFALPDHEPWIAIIGDDLLWALGPQGFHDASLRALLSKCAFVAIVTTEAIPLPYNKAATFAARDRLNTAVIDTRPEQKDAWLALAREVTPDAEILVSVPWEVLG